MNRTSGSLDVSASKRERHTKSTSQSTTSTKNAEYEVLFVLFVSALCLLCSVPFPVGQSQAAQDDLHLAEQGDGLHLAPSGSILNSEVLMVDWVKYFGSWTITVSMRYWSPLASVMRLKYSVRTVSVL